MRQSWGRRFRLPGSGAFACQPRARPMPVMWIRCQAGADWVVLHIVNQTVQFRLIAYTMVEGFILPEGLPRSAQDQVGLSRCRTFQPTHNHRQGGLGQQQYMNMVGHDYPGSELIKIPSVLAVQEGIGHYTRYSGIPQPNRPERRLVHFTVQDKEGSPCG